MKRFSRLSPQTLAVIAAGAVVAILVLSWGFWKFYQGRASVPPPVAAQQVIENPSGFRMCNATSGVVEAAFGYRENLTWISEGWWSIPSGQCMKVYARPLTQRFYFYFARGSKSPSPVAETGPASPTVWEGRYVFCILPKAFKIEGDGDCEARGYQTQGFRDVDVGPNNTNSAITFRDPN